MRLITVRRQYSEGDVFKLDFWGDWHRLNRNCAKDKLTADRDEIAADEKTMYVHMGDGSDCITPDDPRYDPRHVDWSLLEPEDAGRIPDVTVHDRATFESPVIDKCIAALDGNHERKLNQKHRTNVTLRALEQMGHSDVYCPGGAFIRIVFTDRHRHACTVVVNAMHGNKTSNNKATLLNALMSKMRKWEGVDIIARGHCHHLGFTSDSRLGANANHTRLVDRNVYAVLSGGYLKTYIEDGACYAEDADLDPLDIGMQRLLIYPSRSGATVRAFA